jgi:hypothetical protein
MSKPTVQAFTAEVKQQIADRQYSQCALCGMRVTNGAQFHHRKPRRMGGGRDPRLGLPSNGLLLHSACHDKIESRREWAKSYGWILTWNQDPATTPVLIAGLWALLGEDGGMTITGKGDDD